MRTRFEKPLEKPKNRAPRWLGDLSEKFRHKKNFAHVLARNNNLSTAGPNQIQTHSNRAIHATVERQQCNGLIYANIVRFK